MSLYENEDHRLRLLFARTRGTTADEIQLECPWAPYRDAWRVAAAREIAGTVLLDRWMRGVVSFRVFWRLATNNPRDGQAQIRELEHGHDGRRNDMRQPRTKRRSIVRQQS